MKHILITIIAAVVLVGSALADPIHDEVIRGDIKAVRSLLNSGVDVNVKNEKGWTPLHFAASEGQVDVFNFLISKNADVRAVDRYGMTVLHLVAWLGHDSAVQIEMLDAVYGLPGAIGGGFLNPIVLSGNHKGKTPLDLSFGDTQEWLRNHGGKTGSELGNIDIFSAVKDGDIEAVRKYLDEGGDTNASDIAGLTSLHYASRYDQKEIVQLLIINGASINSQSDNGLTPLHVNGKTGNKEITELLLDQGAVVNPKDVNGKTPLDYAIDKKHKGVVTLLREHGGKAGAEYTFLIYINVASTMISNRLLINGNIGLEYEVLYSSDLNEWQVLDSVKIDKSPLVYLLNSTNKEALRFYKLRLVE